MGFLLGILFTVFIATIVVAIIALKMVIILKRNVEYFRTDLDLLVNKIYADLDKRSGIKSDKQIL